MQFVVLCALGVEEARTCILTPKRSIDILLEVPHSPPPLPSVCAQARGKPYVIVFVGVNGVGKSTNLAKVAYWLLQNQVKVREEARAERCRAVWTCACMCVLGVGVVGLCSRGNVLCSVLVGLGCVC